MHLGKRVALVLVPWALAAAFVVLTIDGVAFKRPGGSGNELGPGAPSTPADPAPAPKSQERTIDPSERVPV